MKALEESKKYNSSAQHLTIGCDIADILTSQCHLGKVSLSLRVLLETKALSTIIFSRISSHFAPSCLRIQDYCLVFWGLGQGGGTLARESPSHSVVSENRALVRSSWLHITSRRERWLLSLSFKWKILQLPQITDQNEHRPTKESVTNLKAFQFHICIQRKSFLNKWSLRLCF